MFSDLLLVVVALASPREMRSWDEWDLAGSLPESHMLEQVWKPRQAESSVSGTVSAVLPVFLSYC